MKTAVIGGDRRSVLLCRGLVERGHAVRSYALAPPDAPSLEEALAGAEVIILPLPSVRNGQLYAPLSNLSLTAEAVLEAAERESLRRGEPVQVLAAGLPERDAPVPVRDYFADESLLLQNALLTADGALGLLLGHFGTLQGRRILIGGFGRIGKFLAARCSAIGAHVTVAARNPAERAHAACLGYSSIALPLTCLNDNFKCRFDALVNTVPAHVYEKALPILQGLPCWDLASPPWGFSEASTAALEVVRAPGLPGRCAPDRAAEAILHTILRMVQGEEAPGGV